MQLEGLHHITAITGDAPRNVDFYVRVLGLRMVKKTVNQDDPSVYHLFYADEAGSAGADLTFFEYPRARRGRPGDGTVHRIVWRVGSEDSLAFWADRLGAEGVAVQRAPGSLRFADPEDLELELVVSTASDAPLLAAAPDVPADHALQGFEGVRAYARHPSASRSVLEDVLGFRPLADDAWEARGRARGGTIHYDPPSGPGGRGLGGAGTVHHVAWAMRLDEQDAWQTRLQAAGLGPTPVIDRFYFRSVYFREPSGVLFELATVGPGFAVDEDAAHLGERLSLPPVFEPLRAQVEQVLTRLPDPRAADPRAPRA